MESIARLRDWYEYTLLYQSDRRTSSWLFMSSPYPMITIVIGYLLFIQVAPLYMAKRQPFHFQSVLVTYNFLLVLLSSYILYEFMVTSIFNGNFSMSCQIVDYTDDPLAIRLAGAVWWYFISKVIELLDTIIFILRKKNNQVSFLHVYHHSTMVVLWWLGAKFVAGGESYFSAMLNSFIHVLMYAYYMLSACGPGMQKYLWWKRYMTRLQLLQFFVVVFHASRAAYVNCGFPRHYLYLLIAYMFSHIVLFSNFYYKAYVVKRKQISNGYRSNSTPIRDHNSNNHDLVTNGYSNKTEKIL